MKGLLSPLGDLRAKPQSAKMPKGELNQGVQERSSSCFKRKIGRQTVLLWRQPRLSLRPT